jgi:hypothetical protein
MNSIFDSDEAPLRGEELTRAKENATTRFRLWRMRSAWCTLGLLLSFACVYPFVDGRVLSIREESIKQVLLLLSLGLLVATLYTTLLLWGAWRILRDLELGRM